MSQEGTCASAGVVLGSRHRILPSPPSSWSSLISCTGRLGLTATSSVTWYHLLLAVSVVSKPQSMENGQERTHVAQATASMPKTPEMELIKRNGVIQVSTEVIVLVALQEGRQQTLWHSRDLELGLVGKRQVPICRLVSQAWAMFSPFPSSTSPLETPFLGMYLFVYSY